MPSSQNNASGQVIVPSELMMPVTLLLSGCKVHFHDILICLNFMSVGTSTMIVINESLMPSQANETHRAYKRFF
jgi:hypothetical protein